MKQVLVVGAGFAGAAYARTLAEAGFGVDVIDRRDHIGGNAFDYVDDNGVRVHRYGPHLFHTSNGRVVEWLRRFGDWVPYIHRVRARLPDGQTVPLPINRDTINAVFDLTLASEQAVRDFLASVSVPITAPRNAAEHLHAQIGIRLTDLFFRPYTRKMWALDLEDLDPAVVKRIPLRYDTDDRYFPDNPYQTMPANGYTAVFAAILDHPSISVSTSTSYQPGMEQAYCHCFNSMPIDEFFDCELGELPYRSIRFHQHTTPAHDERDWSVTNYTDSGLFTRETWWHVIPNHRVRDTGRFSITVEEPCDYRDNNRERYYPVKTSDRRYQQLYARYAEMAAGLLGMTFIGRCGTYQYLDMDQVINQSLAGANRWLDAQAELGRLAS